MVLGYINNEARRFHTLVANRVQKIHLCTTSQQWRYVPTNENPADHVSGLNAGEILTSNWLTGPGFLWKKDIPPVVDIDTALTIGDPEVRQAQTLSAQTTEVKAVKSCLHGLELSKLWLASFAEPKGTSPAVTVQ